MKITGVSIGGFKNIETVTLNFSNKITALIGFNNYGKSNVLDAINFGLQFIKANMSNRKKMMSNSQVQPLIIDLKGKPFKFSIQFKDNKHCYSYSYSWYWNTDEVYNEELIRDNLVIHYRNTNTQVVPNLGLLIDKKDSNLQELYKWIKTISAYGADLVTDIKSNTVVHKEHHSTLAKALYDLQNNFSNEYQLLMEAYTSLMPSIKYLKPQIQNNEYRILVKEDNVKTETLFEQLSMGSRRLLALLYMAIKAKELNIQVLFFEEIEACLHPRLIPLLLMSLSKLAIESNIVLTSHSPYLIQHLPINSIYLSLPLKNGLASFKTINTDLQAKLLRQAEELEISLGVYLFDLLIESFYDPQVLMEWL
ncbi:AAA family ATPase [Clostridium sp. 'deep sea']|uniref:AAA family ATPase n=1 Tax=Clostridium sp. 'deep sea' TaxID=2779445 RepID=UPI0018968CE0|nr:ATP-binding protein [Clostridium sp. 'deep sea']QOR34711.1 AAA family ATPase [Clostridium sp. 'deep sea']